MNKNNLLESISHKILPSGCSFFDQQKKVIMADCSIDVVAGPCSGKTTVLIAKCALLMQQNFNNNKGICLITHTNVAVDEIKNGIKKIGFDAEYPNFVGTIQEFFNMFFAKKAFHMVQRNNNNFRVMDDDEYQEKFEEIFKFLKPERYSDDYNYPNASKRDPYVSIRDDCTFEIFSDAPPFYEIEFNESVKRLFNRGIVNNQQCLQLSKWYIDRFENRLLKSVSERFNYVLLDEAQDTNILQYELLSKLFSDGSISFQKFGDPYQALYNIFEGNLDVWRPIEENPMNYREISKTSRFGSRIANIVKNVCVEKYDSFKSLEMVKSFSPYYIIYKDGNDLIAKYNSLIRLCETTSHSFEESNRKDAILSTFHRDLTNLYPNYLKPTIKSKKSQSISNQAYNFLVNLIRKELDESFKEVKEVISSNLQCKIILSECIKKLVSGEYESHMIIHGLEEVLAILLNDCNKKYTNTNINDLLDAYQSPFLSNGDLGRDQDMFGFYLGTIHSAKGETHRSTMLLLDTVSTVYIDNKSFEYPTLELLKEYLVGNYTHPDEITDEVERDETIKALKLAYVALSRPSHLVVIGISESKLDGNKDFVDRLNKNGWQEYSLSI